MKRDEAPPDSLYSYLLIELTLVGGPCVICAQKVPQEEQGDFSLNHLLYNLLYNPLYTNYVVSYYFYIMRH